MDAEFVATCAPGVAGVEPISDTEYRTAAKVGVGSLSFKFGMTVKLIELEPPTRATMRVQGKAPGSVLDATSTVVLSATSAKATELAWTASADARGSLAGTGARLLKGTAGKLIEQFWATFAKRVEKASR